MASIERIFLSHNGAYRVTLAGENASISHKANGEWTIYRTCELKHTNGELKLTYKGCKGIVEYTVTPDEDDRFDACEVSYEE